MCEMVEGGIAGFKYDDCQRQTMLFGEILQDIKDHPKACVGMNDLVIVSYDGELVWLQRASLETSQIFMIGNLWWW